jgi:hypothetical protein
MDDHVAPDEALPFLARLGLRDDADVRAIKRAYAREVKQIDQENDAMGFQDLRDAYETALRWAAYQQYLAQQAALEPEAETDQAAAAGGAAGADAQPAPRPAPTILETAGAAEPIDPDALSKLVFERLMATIPSLLQDPAIDAVAPFKAALLRRLDDDELFNITARACFEARIAYHLADGWQPGNEMLLPAAAAVFEWANDRRRLEQFGRAGSLVNQVIDECNLFDQQQAADLELQRNIMLRLRSGKPRTILGLRMDVPWLETMLERFPAMMHFLTPRPVFQEWRERHAAHAEAGAGAAPVSSPEPALDMGTAATNGARYSLTSWFIGVVVVFIAFFALVEAGAPKRRAPAKEQSIKPLSKKVQEVEAGFRRAIRDDIAYKPGPHIAAGTYSVDFLVHYDADGKIESVSVLNKSADPEYDRAVENAILRSGPYLARHGSSGILILKYSYEIFPRLSRAELDAISDSIDYQLMDTTPLGTHRVEYDVRFNKQGKASAQLVKASTDPRYDKAVLRAILRAKPVKANLGKEWSTTVQFGTTVTRKAAAKSDRAGADHADSNPAAAGGADAQDPSTSSPPAAH